MALAQPGCFVCRKHRDRGSLMPGGPVAEDELFLVSHIVSPEALGGEGTTAYLGHLFVEPRRHAPGLADLTDAEARRGDAAAIAALVHDLRASLTARQPGSVRPSKPT